MGTISRKIINKAFLILLNTLIFGLLFFFLVSSETGYDSPFLFYLITFLTFNGYSFINNQLVTIAPKYSMIFYSVIFSIILILSFIYLSYSMFILFPFVFFYILLLYIIENKTLKTLH